MSAQVDYAQAGELKFGQVGIANLRVRTLDPAQLAEEMRERVQRAPNLFARAAVVLDFGGLSKTPTLDEAQALVSGLRDAGVLPVALAYAERDGNWSGRDLITVMVAGYEIGTRVGNAATMNLFYRGFHPQGTSGAFVAASSRQGSEAVPRRRDLLHRQILEHTASNRHLNLHPSTHRWRQRQPRISQRELRERRSGRLGDIRPDLDSADVHHEPVQCLDIALPLDDLERHRSRGADLTASDRRKAQGEHQQQREPHESSSLRCIVWWPHRTIVGGTPRPEGSIPISLAPVSKDRDGVQNGVASIA